MSACVAAFCGGSRRLRCGTRHRRIREQPWHRFVPDSLPFDGAMMRGVIGHRQLTDAYLVALAASAGARLVTLDRGLAALHRPAALLIDA